MHALEGLGELQVIGASLRSSPHCTMASGEAAMTKDITPKEIMPPAAATI